MHTLKLLIILLTCCAQSVFGATQEIEKKDEGTRRTFCALISELDPQEPYALQDRPDKRTVVSMTDLSVPKIISQTIYSKAYGLPFALGVFWISSSLNPECSPYINIQHLLNPDSTEDALSAFKQELARLADIQRKLHLKTLLLFFHNKTPLISEEALKELGFSADTCTTHTIWRIMFPRPGDQNTHNS